MRRPSLACVLVAVGCAHSLPSETPLGEGPLAKAEALLAAKQAPKKPEKGEPAPKAAAAAAGGGGAAPASPAPAPEAPPAETAKPGPLAPAPPAGKKPAGAVVVYAGEYVGSDTSTYKLSGMDRSEKDDKARTRVEGTGPQITVTFVDSSNGKDICTLKATAQGKTATFAAGQKCWASDASTMSGTLTRGTATFDDKKLVVDADFDIQVGQGELRMSGQLVYHFEGTRK